MLKFKKNKKMLSETFKAGEVVFVPCEQAVFLTKSINKSPATSQSLRLIVVKVVLGFYVLL